MMMFFSAHMAINCIINCILSQVRAPPHRGNEGENDDPPARPNVFLFVFSHSTCPSSVFLSCLPRCKTLWPGWQKIEAAVAETPPVPSTLNTGSDVSLCTKLQYKKTIQKKFNSCQILPFFLSQCQSNYVSSRVLAKQGG